MKRNISSYSHHDEKFKQLRNEDSEIDLRSRTKEERLQHRREAWLIQQEREREHQRLMKKMILEYELRRIREIEKLGSERSKSRSPDSRDRSNTSNTSKTVILSDKLESSDDISLFRGPEGIQINATELQKIKLEIHRDLPGKSTTTTVEVKRDIINPEDVILIRRTGEGSKPIFEREEIKNVLTKINKIKEHDTVLVVNIEKSGNESKKYATSSNSLRNRTHGFQHTSSRYSRERSYSRDRNREYRKKDRRYEKLHNEKEKLLEERTSRKRYSRSREREQKSYKNENSYRKYRETSKERSRDRRERERSKESKIISSLSNNYNYNNCNYKHNKLYYNIINIEQIPVPVPIYCGNFPPRPMGPWFSMQEQIPRFRHIGPPTPFPRFISPNAYRFRPPLNPRFGPTQQ